MAISFTKMHGLGNDFIVIDATKQPFCLTQAQICLMAHRRYGIGFDQLLVIEPAKESAVDFNYRIFNADGSEVEQCGNGARCIARYIYDLGLSNKRRLVLKTMNVSLSVTIEANQKVSVNMGRPSFDPRDIPFLVEKASLFYELEILGQLVQFSLVALGNPHAVIVVNNFFDISIATMGMAFNQHVEFPKGINVGFMKVVSPTHIELRVYERGVGETLACGSGACAAAVIGKKIGMLEEVVFVSQPGGDLSIRWQGPDAPIFMQGPAEFVYRGTWF